MSQVWNKTEPQKQSPLDSPAISIAFTHILGAFRTKLPRGFKNATLSFENDTELDLQIWSQAQIRKIQKNPATFELEIEV